mmetsp:Transcript_76564/g.151489  ORF Transcript_76564/g.151489 Transcript_76564/m.151489 type:complete len:136 (-) Transcript_76564:61-468(-)
MRRQAFERDGSESVFRIGRVSSPTIASGSDTFLQKFDAREARDVRELLLLLLEVIEHLSTAPGNAKPGSGGLKIIPKLAKTVAGVTVLKTSGRRLVIARPLSEFQYSMEVADSLTLPRPLPRRTIGLCSLPSPSF